jgi:hypothetical protein
MKIFILSILLTFRAAAEEFPGQQLLSYFSSNCRTQGEWTRAALADSTALIQALKTLSQDENCRSVGGAIAQLELLNNQLKNLETVNSTKSQIAELNAQEQQLLIHLTTTAQVT